MCVETQTVLVIKFLLRRADADADGDGGEEEVYGKVMMVDGAVKRNLGKGKTEVVRVCESEEERVEALKEYFDITLTEEEREGIRGREGELVGKGVSGRNSWL